MKYGILALLVFLSFFAGCDKTGVSNRSSRGEAMAGGEFEPFVIYKDKGTRGNHFAPSGFMPNGDCIEMNDSWKEGCYEGKSCIKNVYDIECSKQNKKWVGIYWLNPADNWGNKKGG